ncbi:nucleotidyl transferase AbiEii/AbiGii toxin family protein [Engelhardtia mirabilis]|uniref:Nucleotidyl transferase AbiEii toxin, Type IV TA system n=1 Tax=Engelhardtia mirabilis TaxID=2528011 RepID=A0A518BIZ5_9BACT|nr:hypothetical protein Pla133_20010 [Planctomycetes bacterium Pla133]QDV01252.1 hypothetical protein Pla86_20010 [Planctomycetes bacterium Pla86]
MTKQYDDPVAFRAALLARLRNVAAERGQAIQDLQLRLLIERLLARLFMDPDPPWRLKGGFAMELRYRPRARTTRDLDLTIRTVEADSNATGIDEIRDALQEAAEFDLGDHFEFRIGGSTRALPGAPLGGATFPVDVVLAGRSFGRFQIDAGLGDPTGGAAEQLHGDNLLAFAGIEPVTVLAVPKPQQFAEKLHAYTFPWTGRVNSRSKDLVDLVLLIERGDLVQAEVAAAVAETFARRATHELSVPIPAPPAIWQIEFEAMAKQVELSAATLEVAFERLGQFVGGL